MIHNSLSDQCPNPLVVVVPLTEDGIQILLPYPFLNDSLPALGQAQGRHPSLAMLRNQPPYNALIWFMNTTP